MRKEFNKAIYDTNWRCYIECVNQILFIFKKNKNKILFDE